MESRSSSKPPAERLVASPDLFGLLGLPTRFDLDPQEIERAFFEKSKDYHSDRFANAPAAERVVALSRSRALNDAYQVIKKPVPRAEYLLEQAGVTIGDNERLDPAFLMEILELREELADARAANKLPEVERLQSAMVARRKAAIDSLAPLFAAKDLPTLKRTLIVLRYLNRYLEECDAALDEE
ncbi:MAG: Fe-S protein assembly co-chaperone HscB [Deltaproteobacteria bacterium]|nr:Fe-S protein assembly co-chaperone HscB [Deltaproteobacteria bacterium]